MSELSVCPAAVVHAPVERVWGLLTDPESLDLWVDATLVAAEPDGPVQPGQRLHLVTRALGWSFAVTIEVVEVDSERRRLRLLVTLPLGIVNDETITLAEAGEDRTAVRFG